jgi:hypothetical protein
MKKMIGLLIGLAILVLYAGTARAMCPDSCEAYWSPVTQYTDNTAIETQDLPISYIAEWDGTLLPATTAVSVPLPKPYGHGVSHVLRVKARTARGTESVFSPPFPWTSPEGIPKSPPGTGAGVR